MIQIFFYIGVEAWVRGICYLCCSLFFDIQHDKESLGTGAICFSENLFSTLTNYFFSWSISKLFFHLMIQILFHIDIEVCLRVILFISLLFSKLMSNFSHDLFQKKFHLMIQKKNYIGMEAWVKGVRYLCCSLFFDIHHERERQSIFRTH